MTPDALRPDKGASADADRAVVNGAGQAVSALRASVPSAVRGFTVDGGRRVVTPTAIAAAIDSLANIPERFKSYELANTLLPGGGWYAQEATNRLMQRWRKMGLVVFERGGRWRLTRGSWDRLQAQAIEARRAETQSGSVHESAVAKPCAQTPSGDDQ